MVELSGDKMIPGGWNENWYGGRGPAVERRKPGRDTVWSTVCTRRGLASGHLLTIIRERTRQRVEKSLSLREDLGDCPAPLLALCRV